MKDPTLASQLDLAILVAGMREETLRWLRGEPRDDSASLEVFRRALVLRDAAAWEAIITQYRGVVLSYVAQHSAIAQLGESEDYWISRTFERFWRAVTPDRFAEFKDLTALLKYLKLCAHSIVMNELRLRRATSVSSLDEVPESAASLDVTERVVGQLQQLRQAIKDELGDETEQLIARLSFIEDLKPTIIYQRHPDRFASVADVYRVKRNVVDRLRRNPGIRALISGECSSPTKAEPSWSSSRSSSGKGPPSDKGKPTGLGWEDEPHERVARPYAVCPSSDGPHAPTDLVECSVFAPPTFSPGEVFLVQVVAHQWTQAQLARQLAHEFDPGTERHGVKALEMEIERGAKLEFYLTMPGLTVDDTFQSLVWRGAPQAVQFSVAASNTGVPRAVIGTVTVWLDRTPIGHIKFRLALAHMGDKQTTVRPRRLGESARFYRQAFVSYASQDLTEVLKRVQMLSMVRIPYFQDVLSLEPGERWKRALYRHIDESDLFLLFWSTAAKRSKWVLKEVQYAIERKHGDDASPPEIIPVPIEGPPPVLPPKILEHLHFNDRLLYFMCKE